jgi:hypothetical protein
MSAGLRRVVLTFVALAATVGVARADPNAANADRIEALIAGEPGAHVVAHDGAPGFMIQLDGSDHVAATVLLSTRGYGPIPPRVTTPSFYVYTNVQHVDDASIERVSHLIRTIASRDDGLLGFEREPFRHVPESLGTLVACTLFALAWATVLIASERRVVFQFRPSHLIPALLQTSIFTYWSLYWPAVAHRVPSIVVQIVLAYAVDAIVSILKDRTWRVGFGPLPIVLSSNLFAWFTDVGAVVVIVVAVVSRTFIRRGGRHVFNPSAAGLTVAGFLSLFWPPFAFGGVFHTLAMPPNIAEVILLLSLVPQMRFRIVLISLGAALGLHFGFPGHGVGLPGLLLAFALFATDPATVPGTPVGQLLFGAFVGSATLGFSNLLVYCGQADDLSKVFPIPIANALVPLFDAIGETGVARGLFFLGPRWNLAHVALWLCFAVPDIAGTKPGQFLIAPHADYVVPLVHYRDGGLPRCEDNPIFCRPFTFAREVAGWAEARRVGDSPRT